MRMRRKKLELWGVGGIEVAVGASKMAADLEDGVGNRAECAFPLMEHGRRRRGRLSEMRRRGKLTSESGDRAKIQSGQGPRRNAERDEGIKYSAISQR